MNYFVYVFIQENKDIQEELLKFLINWLNEHILGTDMELKGLCAELTSRQLKEIELNVRNFLSQGLIDDLIDEAF